jgi:prepilin-type N-terminal cleavage/methylation domain-containing protein
MKLKKNNVGFTLIELLIVIAIIGILAALLFPVFANVRKKSLETVCISNARQMGLGLYEYIQDNDEQLMTRSDNDAGDTISANVDPNPADFQSWFDWVQPYVKSYDVQKCPAFGGPYPIENNGRSSSHQVVKRYIKCTYLISSNIIGNLNKPSNNLAAISSPAETILIAESPSGATSFAEVGTGLLNCDGPTAQDYLLSPGYTTDAAGNNGVANGPGSMHFVNAIQTATAPACPGPTPPISAWVTCIAVDGHAKSVLLNNADSGDTTRDANGLVHDPPGGFGGMYFTGPDGELTLN